MVGLSLFGRLTGKKWRFGILNWIDATSGNLKIYDQNQSQWIQNLLLSVMQRKSKTERTWPAENSPGHLIKCALDRRTVHTLLWRSKEGLKHNFLHIQVLLCEVRRLHGNVRKWFKHIPAIMVIQLIRIQFAERKPNLYIYILSFSKILDEMRTHTSMKH